MRRWLAGTALTLGILLALATGGPPGQAYRTDEAFSAGVASIDPSHDPAGWGQNARVCVIDYCVDWEPTRIELAGIWIRFRVSEFSSGASCVGPPDPADIFVP